MAAERGNKKERRVEETLPDLCQTDFKELRSDSVHLLVSPRCEYLLHGIQYISEVTHSFHWLSIVDLWPLKHGHT